LGRQGLTAKQAPHRPSTAPALGLRAGGGDEGYGIAVDGFGNAYLTGETASTDFLTTTNAFQSKFGGPKHTSDAYVTKITASWAGCPTSINTKASDGLQTPCVDRKTGPWLTSKLILETDGCPAASGQSAGCRFLYGFISVGIYQTRPDQLQIPSKRLPTTRV
jgi:hypothetical protein